MTTLEQWQSGREIEGYPPYDGTGIPFPLGEDGIPDLPEPPDYRVAPGATTPRASTDPEVTADPQTPWAADEYATFSDGDFTWDGDSWVAWTAPPDPEPDPTMGWTKAELIEFAANHEPPIALPADANKAEILALILAAIQADPNEEN